MQEFNQDQFISACQSGNIDEIKKMMGQGVDVNYTDKTGCNGLHYAAKANQLWVMHFLQANGISFDVIDKEGNTPLHFAAENNNKETTLFLLIQNVDPTIKNNLMKAAGEGNTDMKAFMSNIIAEKPAFDALNETKKRKLLQIFEDIDDDNQKYIDLAKSIKFNKFIDDTVNDNFHTKDANDFLKFCGICNKSSVNIDEWYFSFAKLFVVEPETYEKFIADYDRVVEAKGKLRNQ